MFRRRHFKALQDEIYEHFDSSFWEERDGRSIRLSSSTTDHQLAYIDFINYDNRKSDYIGPQLPITLLLAGNGHYNSPYYLNFEDDALAKSIVYFDQATMKEKLPIFFENLNTLLAKLSFYKFNRQIMRDLGEIIDWIELGNKTLFNPLDTKATLFLFENSYQEVEGGSFKQRRRSLPIDALVLEAFPEMFVNMISFIQHKLLGKKSEIRLGLVFRPFNFEKRKKLLERVRRRTMQRKAINDRLSATSFDSSSTQFIYGSDDEDDEMQAAYQRRKPMQVVKGGNSG